MSVLWLCIADDAALRKVRDRPLLSWKRDAAVLARAERVILSGPAGLDLSAVEGFAAIEHPTALRTPPQIVRHVLGALWQTGETQPTHVMLIDPTVPFTRWVHYEQALAFSRRGYDLVQSMVPVEPPTVFTARIEGDGSINALAARLAAYGEERQTFDAEWRVSPSLTLFRTDVFLHTGSMYGGARNRGLLVDRWSALEVTDDESAALAAWAVERGLV